MIRRFLLLSLALHAAVFALDWPAGSPPRLPIDGMRAELAGSPAPLPAPARPTGAAASASVAAPVASDQPVKPVATVSTLSGDSGRDARAQHLQVRLRGLLAEHFHYPPLARRNGWEGRVELLLALDGRGGIRALSVARSSGYAVLDEDALATLRRIGANVQARSQLAGCACELRLPVLYRLVEG